MSNKSIEPVSPHHVYLYDADWDYITERFGVRGFGNRRVGVGKAIRNIVHSWVKATRAREANRISEIADLNPTEDEDEEDYENA